MTEPETNAQRLKRLRADAMARGDCYECRCRPRKSETVKRCQVCLDRSSKRRIANTKKPGRCTSCGTRWKGKRRQCKRCNHAAKKYRAKQAARNIPLGLCAICPAKRSERSTRFCDRHLDEIVARVKDRYWRHKAEALVEGLTE